MQINLLILFVALALTACAELGLNPAQKNAYSEAVDSMVLVQPGKCDGLTYYHNLTRPTSEERSRELAELHQAQKNPDKGCAPLKLAMLFNQPDSNIRDSSKSKSLLDKFIENSGEKVDSDVVLAKLLRVSVEEQIRLQHSRSSLRRRTEQQAIAIKALADRILEMTVQLQQLKSLERDINRQEQAVDETAD